MPIGRELAAAVGGVTRWSADLVTLERNNVTHVAIDLTLEEARTNSRAAPRVVAAAPAAVGEGASPETADVANSEYLALLAEDGYESGETDSTIDLDDNNDVSALAEGGGAGGLAAAALPAAPKRERGVP